MSLRSFTPRETVGELDRYAVLREEALALRGPERQVEATGEDDDRELVNQPRNR